MNAVKTWNSAMPRDHYGSAGCLVRWSDKVGLLSASHVLSPVWRGLSVGANRRISILPDKKIANGELAKWDVPITSDGLPIPASRDAAFATVDEDTEAELIATLGLPAGVRVAQQYGQRAFFFGARSGVLKKTIIHDLAGSVTMRMMLHNNDQASSYTSVYAPLSGLIQTDAQDPVLPGDSGCLLFDSDGYALGLLVGTDPTNTYPYFTHLQPILNQFGATLITTEDHPDAPRLTDLLVGLGP